METKIKSAVRTNIPGLTVGIAEDRRTLLFASKDYDNKGTLAGNFLDVTFIHDAFWVLGYGIVVDRTVNRLGFQDAK